MALISEIFCNRKNDVPSLKKLCECFLFVTLDKSHQCSDWDRRPLTHEQLEYAVFTLKTSAI